MRRCLDPRFFFGLLTSVIGLLFMGILWHAYQRAMETRGWTPVEATIINSRVEDKLVPSNTPPAFIWDLDYRYRFEGEEFTAKNFRRVPTSSGDRERIEMQVLDNPVGSPVTAWVNPEQAGQAVLRHETKAPLYTIWFPFLFVVGGGGMMWACLKGQQRGGQAAGASADGPC